MRPIKVYVSIKEFALINKVFSYAAIRRMRARCKENGFDTAFLKVGKRVIIDVEEFWECARRKDKQVRRNK